MDGELIINENSHIHRERVLDVYVNYVSLDSIYASGASTITSRGIIQNSKLNITASGAAELKLQVVTDSMILKMNQNANVQLAGEATYFNFQINHVGDLMAYNLVSQHCKAILDTGPQSPGVARINVEKTLDVFIEGPRALKYKGNPDITNQVIKGGGTLKKH